MGLWVFLCDCCLYIMIYVRQSYTRDLVNITWTKYGNVSCICVGLYYDMFNILPFKELWRSFRRVNWGTFKLRPVPNVLLRFSGWATCFLETVCNRVWDTFSLVWWVCQKCQPNQQQHLYKPRGIKESSHNGSKWSRLQMCPLQLGIHNNWRY